MAYQLRLLTNSVISNNSGRYLKLQRDAVRTFSAAQVASSDYKTLEIELEKLFPKSLLRMICQRLINLAESDSKPNSANIAKDSNRLLNNNHHKSRTIKQTLHTGDDLLDSLRAQGLVRLCPGPVLCADAWIMEPRPVRRHELIEACKALNLGEPSAEETGVVVFASSLKQDLSSVISSKNYFLPGSVRHCHNNRPNQDQLERVKGHFVEQIPKLLISKHDYSVYTPDIIFENNFRRRPYVQRGLSSYIVEVLKFRALLHMKFSSVRIEVLRASCEPLTDSVRCQWRISGVSSMQPFKFWRRWSAAATSRSAWLEGISTFYVNKDGKVYKHQVDRMMPDTENLEPSLVDRLALSLDGRKRIPST